MNQSTISKSQYLKGLQCPKALWFYRHRKDLKQPVDPATQALFDAGNELGELSKQYFDSGVEVIDKYWEIDKSVNSTENFIKEDNDIIFEATAMDPNNGAYSRIDILRKVSKDTWDLIELKGSTEVKDYHLNDMSFQYSVFTNAGYKINKCYMMLVDNTYVRNGDIEYKKLFKLVDISDEVQKKQIGLNSEITELIKTFNQDEEPDVTIGKRCSDPFNCEYQHHCWKSVPDYSIFNIYQKKKVAEIFKETKSYEINDIPVDLYPNAIKTIDIVSYKENKTHIEKKNIENWLKDLEYPLYFLDYETTNSAIPLFDGTRPYQQIPFQFSLHIKQTADSKLEHFEFIHKEQSDPRRDFTKNLVELCEDKGSVVVYSKSFEMTRNKELARDFLAYSTQLEAINDRVVDLLLPFKKRWLYSPKQASSASIKYVLPAFTELSYEDMDIANGGDAMGQYLAFAKGELSSSKTEKLWKDLSKYCELDTLAMVELLRILKKYT